MLSDEENIRAIIRDDLNALKKKHGDARRTEISGEEIGDVDGVGEDRSAAVGGAAPLHAARLGEKLGVRRIIVPGEAGVGSAVGFLLAPVAYEVVRSRRQLLSALQADVVNGLMNEMHAESRAVVEMGARSGNLIETRQAYMRYVGQGHEIAVSIPVEEYGHGHAAVLRSAFEQDYTRLYGRTIEGVDIEVLSWTLTISEVLPEPGHRVRLGNELRPGIPEPLDPAHPLFDPGLERTVSARVYLRDALKAGTRIEGPALITEAQTTTVVPVGWSARVNQRKNLVLERTP